MLTVEVTATVEAALAAVAVGAGCAMAVPACCDGLFLASGLQALTQAISSKTPVKLSKILRWRFIVILLGAEISEMCDR